MKENKEKFSIDTEELKNETIKTAKKFKETVRKTNIKEETKTTKGIIIEMFKNPLGKIKEVAADNSGKYLKTAIFLIAIWVILIFVSSCYTTIYYYGFSRIFCNILNILKRILAPIIGILTYSLIILFLNKNNKKSLIDIISTITLTQLPLMVASLTSLLTIISSNISIITSPFKTLCQITTAVLSFFGFKYLLGDEENETFIKKYIKIQALYAISYILISLLGIYI